jgi:hypothetical protein
MFRLDIGNTNESIKRDATRIALNHILMVTYNN